MQNGKQTPMNKLKNQMAAVTGDETRPMLYALAVIAASVFVVLVLRKKVNNRADWGLGGGPFGDGV